MQLLVLVLVAVVVEVIRRARNANVARYARARGWDYVERDDELGSTWTLPPFVDLRTPLAPGVASPENRPRPVVRDVLRFHVDGSPALSFQHDVISHVGDSSIQMNHVVAIWTRQGLPRTVVRQGIDTYEVPAYEGLQRVREPKVRTRAGELAIVSEDPDAVATLGLEEIAPWFELTGRISRATLMTDGDWVLLVRSSGQSSSAIEPMVDFLRRFARDLPGGEWPIPSEVPDVYGAI